MRMFCGVHEHDTVLIEQPSITLDEYCEVLLVIEAEPCSAVRQSITIHCRSRVECRTHPRAGIAIPASARRLRVDTGFLPQAHLGLAGATVVTACDERRFGARDPAERRHYVLAAIDMCGVASRADQNKVVIHDLAAVDAEAAFDKGKFCRPIVHEYNIAVTALANLKRLPGADRDHPDLN